MILINARLFQPAGRLCRSAFAEACGRVAAGPPPVSENGTWIASNPDKHTGYERKEL